MDKRHKWSDDDIAELKTLFKAFFEKDKTPGEDEVRHVQEKSRKAGGNLWRLSMNQIKSKVSWLRLYPPKGFKL